MNKEQRPSTTLEKATMEVDHKQQKDTAIDRNIGAEIIVAFTQLLLITARAQFAFNGQEVAHKIP